MAFNLTLINESEDSIEHVFIGKVVNRKIVPEADLLPIGDEMVPGANYLFKDKDNHIGKILFVKGKTRTNLSMREIEKDTMGLRYTGEMEDFFVTFSNGREEVLQYFGFYDSQIYQAAPPEDSENFKTIKKVDLEQGEETTILVSSNITDSDRMFIQWSNESITVGEPLNEIIEDIEIGKIIDLGEINIETEETEEDFEEEVIVSEGEATMEDIEFFQPK